MVKGKPIFALDFEKGKGFNLLVPAVPGRGYEKVTSIKRPAHVLCISKEPQFELNFSSL